MGSGAIKWHVHCSVCGAFIEKSAQSDSEVECKKCRSTLEIFVKDDMVSVRPIHIRDEVIVNMEKTELFFDLFQGKNLLQMRNKLIRF